MAKITDLTELDRATVADHDYLVVVDISTTVTKWMYLDSLLGALDGDQLDIDWNPSYYTPAATPAQADDVDDLTAHLYGIDQKLAEIDAVGTEQASSSYTVGSDVHYVEFNTSAGAITASLTSAATLGVGYKYTFKVTNATNPVLISPAGAETIDGLTALYMTTVYETMEIISDGTNWKIINWRNSRKPMRGQFSYNNATSYKVTAACYDLHSSIIDRVFWRSTLTLGPSTWAAGSTSIATTGWHYLYIDKSAVEAAYSQEIGADEFISSTTAPTWSTSYQGWYNASGDRCIFMAWFSAASTLVEFFHDVNFVFYADSAVESDTNYTSTWKDVQLYGPGICTRLEASFELKDAVLSTSTGWWRTNSQTGTTGHRIGYHYWNSDPGLTHVGWQGTVRTDTNQKIEIKIIASAGASTTWCTTTTVGFYLPEGM